MAVLPIEQRFLKEQGDGEIPVLGMLKELEYGVRLTLSDLFFHKADWEVERDACMRAFEVTLTQKLIGETVDVIEVPSSWWQHLKQAHFPRWLLKYFPIDFKRYEARALYPKVSLPLEEHKVIFEEML